MRTARYQMTVKRAVETGQYDAHGNPIVQWVEFTVPVYGMAPGPSAERLLPGREIDAVTCTAYCPAGVDVQARDRAIWKGGEYDVVGDALDYSDGPFGAPGGVVVELKRTSG